VKLQLLYFAAVRDRLGREGESMVLPDGISVAAALDALVRRYEDRDFAGMVNRLQIAVNRNVVTREHPLCDGDEVALLPPVAGGMDQPKRLAILDRTLSIDAVVRSVSGPAQGGIVTFTGVVRRHGQLPEVERLEYEAFVPMALSVLAEIAHEIETEIPGTQVAIHHRIGNLLVGEPAVIIAVSAPHRAEAFSGCRTAIEALKQRVPIWKKEIGPDGNAWIGMGP